VTFTAAASGSPAPTYQWQFGGTTISGATSASYTIASAATTNAGTYTLVATNSAGSATSNGAVLTVSSAPPATTAPAITTQPASQTVPVGSSVTFTAAASGSPAPTYQWQKDGIDLAGVTTASYTIVGVSAADAGEYRVVATNSAGSATSGYADLTVIPSLSTLPPPSGSPFQYPAGITRDSSGNLYLADSSTDTIRKITPDGVISTLAGSSNVAGDRDGIGTAALFNQPQALVADATGNIYVADTGNSVIRWITPAGVVTTLAGTTANRGNQDGVGTAASFNSPAGIAMDDLGNLYVADAFNATIRKIASDRTVTTIAGSAMNRGDSDGTGTAALFNYPNGIASDTSGNLYVADTYNDTIRKITPSGAVTTLAGSAGISGASDGTEIVALFNQPYGTALDAAGDVYVADTGNETIRRVTPAGVVTTVAGIAGVAGLRDGAGSNALFNQPRSLVVDPAGNIYVVDTGNALIRLISPSGAVSTPTFSSAPASNQAPPPPLTPDTATPATSSPGGGGAIEPGLAAALLLLTGARLASHRKRHRSQSSL
jgi:sugar lactone lactonase YvrE